METISWMSIALLIGAPSQQCPAAAVLPTTNRTISDNLTFIFYPPGGNVSAERFPYKYSLSILQHPLFDPSKKTVLYHHGLNENCSQLVQDQSCIRVVKGFQAYGKVNLILVDYASLVAGDAYTASVNVKNMGPLLCNFYRLFFIYCNCNNNTDVIGYSLGSHVVHAGSKNCPLKPSNIVSLDAANIPYFRNDHINSKDGSFVQAIHTSGGYYGLKTSYGRVDFFPNGGQKQDPACSPGTDLMKLFDNNKVLCSHYSSVVYFMNSVANKTLYPSTKCNKKTSKEYYMGYWLDKKARGNYCLKTGTAGKFSKIRKGSISKISE